MSFDEVLAEFTAVELVERLHCSERAAYAWKAGSRQPPEWVQRLIVLYLQREARKRQRGHAREQ